MSYLTNQQEEANQENQESCYTIKVFCAINYQLSTINWGKCGVFCAINYQL